MAMATAPRRTHATLAPLMPRTLPKPHARPHHGSRTGTHKQAATTSASTAVVQATANTALAAAADDATTLDKPHTTLPAFMAQRFHAMVQQGVERLDLIGLLLSDAAARLRDQPAAARRKDIATLLDTQDALERRFDDLLRLRGELRGLSNKKKYMRNQEELARLSNDLKKSTSMLCQTLRDRPTIVGDLIKTQRDRSKLQDLLEATAADLAHGSFGALVERVQKRLDDSRLLGEAQARQERTMHAVAKLETELEAEWSRFDRLEAERNSQLAKLELQLKTLKHTSALTIKYEQDTLLSKQQATHRAREHHLDGIRAKIAEYKGKLDLDAFVHKRTKDFLNRWRAGLDEKHDQWKSKYETEVKERKEELRVLTEKRTACRAELDALQARWEEDKAFKAARVAENAQKQIDDERRRVTLERMHLAQAKIRFIWRCYLRKKNAKKKRRARLRKKRLAAKKKKMNSKYNFGT